MAGSKVKIHGKLAGSTILEVVISMIIIILVFGTAMMIYANVSRLSLSVKKLRAQAILQEILLQDTSLSDDQKASSLIDGFRIEQQLKPVENEPKLTQIILTAFDDNQEKVAQVQQIIIKDYVSN
jgi:Tfp pilus assembly protein PilV